ncbi:unnamed protein product [Closterium sp. NIES-54]
MGFCGVCTVAWHGMWHDMWPVLHVWAWHFTCGMACDLWHGMWHDMMAFTVDEQVSTSPYRRLTWYHGYCLAFLENHLQPGNRVLDVGSGSGYLTAVMALLVGPTGRAVGVEHIPELVERSRAAVKAGRAAELMDGGQLSIHEADGRHGYPDAGPYDAIHVGAAAPELPQALVDQLKPGGRMVIPVGRFMQDLEVIDKGADGTVTRTTAMGVRYVPLTAKAKQLGREGHNSHGRAIHAADCYGEAAGEGVRETERSEWVCEEVSE